MNSYDPSTISRTVTVILPAPKETVFSFLSKPENLPAWATEFCQELKREGTHHVVVTSSGDLYFRIEADAATGVIDMFSGPTPEEQAIFPCRVISMSEQTSAVTFTFFRPPEMTIEIFERQHGSLILEMDGLVRFFSARR